jgi:hypothetical protein
MKTIAFVFIPVESVDDLKARLHECTAIFSESAVSGAAAELSKPEHAPDGCQFWTWFIDNPCPRAQQ